MATAHDLHIIVVNPEVESLKVEVSLIFSGNGGLSATSGMDVRWLVA